MTQLGRRMSVRQERAQLIPAEAQLLFVRLLLAVDVTSVEGAADGRAGQRHTIQTHLHDL